jgi:hypothetical protein
LNTNVPTPCHQPYIQVSKHELKTIDDVSSVMNVPIKNPKWVRVFYGISNLTFIIVLHEYPDQKPKDKRSSQANNQDFTANISIIDGANKAAQFR